jgi:glucokinase
LANAIGVDIGGTNVRAARVSREGVLLAHTIEPTPPTAAATLALIDALIAGMANVDTLSIGIGVPGRVNAATGEVFSGGYVNLAGPPLSTRINAGRRPVFTDNDASMALIAEQRIGAGRGVENVVLLTIGTGVGGASFIDGAILRGRGTAGQLGHLTVDIDGAPCACGRRGCLETTSSGTSLRRFIAEAGFPARTSVEELLVRDDAPAREILARWAKPLRFGLDTLAAALDPELVLLGGGLGAAAHQALERFPCVSPWFQYRVAPAALGDSAGVIGAGLAALDLAR